jgi:hypothetical protein
MLHLCPITGNKVSVPQVGWRGSMIATQKQQALSEINICPGLFRRLLCERASYLPPWTACSRKGSAFETNAATINSLFFNRLRSVTAFDPFFAI